MTIDRNASRIACGLSVGVLGGVVGLAPVSVPAAALLAFGLALDAQHRVRGASQSPLMRVAAGLVRLAGLPREPVAEEGRRFAAGAMLVGSSSVAALLLLYPTLGLGLAVVLAGLQVADGVLGVCLACAMYARVLLLLTERG